jgi:phenylpropionate dioxygenase-like ring-hydroxylating dioxygenase large terminal subunit
MWRIYILLLFATPFTVSFQPLCLWRDISETRARTFTIENKPIVAARVRHSNGTVAAVAYADGCPHRGASFHGAKIHDGNMTCPYHAAKFSAFTGDMKYSIGMSRVGKADAPCKAFSLRSLRAQQRGVLMWVQRHDTGDTDIPPLEPEQTKSGYRTLHGVVHMQCTPCLIIDNILDCIHIHIVHDFGNKVEPEPLDYRVRKQSECRRIADFNYRTGPSSLFPSTMVRVQNWYHGASTAGSRVTNKNGNTKVVQIHVADRGGGNCDVYYSLSRNFLTWPVFDKLFRAVMKRTLDQDKQVVESIVESEGGVFNSRYDTLQLHFRAMLLKRSG